MRDSWDKTWMKLAWLIADRSLCAKAKYGAVIVSEDNRVLSCGYNGPPAGMEVDTPCWDWCPRYRSSNKCAGYSDCPSIHAEVNALLRLREHAPGQTLYINGAPCHGCATIVANSGIERVVIDGIKDIDAAWQKLTSFGLKVEIA